jgi:hypothetical protein
MLESASNILLIPKQKNLYKVFVDFSVLNY